MPNPNNSDTNILFPEHIRNIANIKGQNSNHYRKSTKKLSIEHIFAQINRTFI